jgi:hypothetical protein
MSYCLERLANPCCWTAVKSSYTWTAAFLAHVLQSQGKLGLFKALQFWGDVLLQLFAELRVRLIFYQNLMFPLGWLL